MEKSSEDDTLIFFIRLMLYSIKNLEDLEKLKELLALQNQVQEVRLQDNLVKQNYQENTHKKIFESVTDTIKNTTEKLTKTLTEKSIKKTKHSRIYTKNF